MDRNWLNNIDLNRMTLYPIQFANCDRLVKNDAVYIFDEVGCGKTISSGLMALDYIHNNNKNVLVITTNALIRADHGAGQFERDWMYRLPFKELGYDERITFINNDYRNIEKQRGKDYGLIIIDEAHLLLNEDTKRREALNKLHSDKVVFLTATPIKEKLADLRSYVEIAKTITGKILPYDWIGSLENIDSPEKLLCGSFGINSPVTRYFKDTVMAINHEGFDKTKVARRLAPMILNYEGGTEKKFEAVSEYMLEKLNSEDTVNRFVVFVRLVEDEAKKFGQYLENSRGFKLFSRWGDGTVGFTYKVVTGDNSFELSDYSISLSKSDNKDRTKLPDVLILTYQIAEQGVNLPCYNHVINMHIPAAPSSLEQRFGRIDRMGADGSVYREIHMCFPLHRTYWDTNKINFYNAVSIYCNSLITHLPSKNTILTEAILKDYCQKKQELEEIKKSFRSLLKDEQRFEALWNTLHSRSFEVKDKLFGFIKENELDISDVETLKSEINDIILAIKDGKNFDEDSLKSLIKEIGNKIFYRSDNNAMLTVDAVDECAKLISENTVFLDYKDEFNKRVRLPLLINGENFHSIAVRYEEDFMSNNLDHIYNINRHYVAKRFRAYLDSAFPKESFTEEEYKFLFKKSREFPLFRLCERFGELLFSKYHFVNKRNKDRSGTRYSASPFGLAFLDLSKEVKQSRNKYGLSRKFLERYFTEYDHRKLFAVSLDKGICEATEWYKVAYWFTRREKVDIYVECVYIGTNNIHSQAEEDLLFVSDLYYQNYNDNEAFYKEMYENKQRIDFWQDRNQYYSFALIEEFLFGRKYVKELGMECPNISECSVSRYDYLTAGLINTLTNGEFNWELSCFFDENELPKELRELKTFYEGPKSGNIASPM